MDSKPYDGYTDLIDKLITSAYYERTVTGGVRRNIQMNAGQTAEWIYANVDLHDDAGPSSMASSFDFLCRKYFEQEVKYPWCLPRGRDFPDLEPISGEIEWRTLHQDPCGECGHSELYHSEDDDGWSSCSHGLYVDDHGHDCSPCNCGNNIGR